MFSIVSLGFTIFALGVFGLIAVFAERHYRGLVELTSPPSPLSVNGEGESNLARPAVDIIIPARNEASNITRVVSSLITLRHPSFRVLVINDGSTDQTAQLAKQAGAKVIDLPGDPPLGWTGKCNACEQGARCSNADWLLFTDADTCHNPDSLAQAIAYAETHKLDALSLLLRQECIGFWERVILPLAYQNFFAVWQADKPAFNGQYILIRRAVYEASGGFGAVRGRVMEDVALAESLARQGYRIGLINGHGAASVRMYTSLPALLRGMTKTAFAAARDRGAAGWLLGGGTFVGVTVIIMFMIGVATGSNIAILGGVLIGLVNAIGLAPWMIRFGVRPIYALFNLPGIALLWLIGMVSTLRVIAGRGVRWKGRTIIEQR